MKTKVGNYYVFLRVEDFWDKVNYYKSLGRRWIAESHLDYNPIVTQDDMPVTLNIDSSSMMHGIVNNHLDVYLKDTTYQMLYREERLKIILGEK